MGSQNYVAIWSQITQIRYKSVRFTQDELTHWTLDTHKINSLTPNAILLQTVPFKHALSITSKLTNNRNITRYSLTALCFLSGGQNIRKVGVTRGDKGDKAGDIRWQVSRSSFEHGANESDCSVTNHGTVACAGAAKLTSPRDQWSIPQSLR